MPSRGFRIGETAITPNGLHVTVTGVKRTDGRELVTVEYADGSRRTLSAHALRKVGRS